MSPAENAIREVRSLLKLFEGPNGTRDEENHIRAIRGHLDAIATDRRLGLERPPERFRCIRMAAHALALIEANHD